MEKENLPLTFAIYPNTKGFGYAILEGPQKLLDHNMVVVSPVSNTKLLERIKKTLAFYKPKIVILQDPDCKLSRAGKRVRRLIDEIVECAEDMQLEVHKYSREKIRAVFAQFKASTKHEIAQVITNGLPELKHKKPTARKIWMNEHHYMGVFDAISLAYAHYYLSE